MKTINKKGALSLTFIITLIILVVSFAVILLFYYAFDWTGQINKQACHQSVIYKATIPVNLVDQKVVELPLNCQTEKICITSSGKEECDNQYLGEKYDVVKLSNNKIDWEEEIKEILKEKTYECWWMMGQGKLQLYSRSALQKKICTICTRVVFGQDVQDELEKIQNFSKYLDSKKIPNSDKTYWDFLTDNDPKLPKADSITTKPQAIIFGEVDSRTWQKWTFRGAGTVVGAKLGGAIGSVVGPAGTVVGAGVGGVLGFLGSKEAGDQVDQLFNEHEVLSAWQIVEYDVDHLKGLGCASFEGKLD